MDRSDFDQTAGFSSWFKYEIDTTEKIVPNKSVVRVMNSSFLGKAILAWLIEVVVFIFVILAQKAFEARIAVWFRCSLSKQTTNGNNLNPRQSANAPAYPLFYLKIVSQGKGSIFRLNNLQNILWLFSK